MPIALVDNILCLAATRILCSLDARLICQLSGYKIPRLVHLKAEDEARKAAIVADKEEI